MNPQTFISLNTWNYERHYLSCTIYLPATAKKRVRGHKILLACPYPLILCFMGPRKRSKPNSKAEGEAVPEEPSLYQGAKLQRKDSLKTSVKESIPPSKLEAVEPVHLTNNGAKTVSAEDGELVYVDTNSSQPQSSKNWYSGTWPRGKKAIPVTQIAKESISAASEATSESLASARAHTPELPATPLKSPALYFSKSIGNSSRSLPLAATTTKVHATSNAKCPMNSAAENGETPKSERESSLERKREIGFASIPEAAKPEDAAPTKTHESRDARSVTSKHQALDVHKATNESASWLHWFSKSDVATEGEPSNADGDAINVIKSGPQSIISEAHQYVPASPERRRNSEPSPITPSVQQEEAPRSWLSLWGNATTQTKSSSSASALALASNPPIESNESGSQPGKVSDAGSGSVSNPDLSKQAVDSTKSSYGWAFWSRDQRKSGNDKTRPGNGLGELALAGSSSQPELESAQSAEARGLPGKVGKNKRPQSLEAPDGVKESQDNDQKAQKPESISLAQKLTPKVDAEPREKRTPNLLLPSFRGTYSLVERPSFIQHVSRLLQMHAFSEPTHVNIVPNPPRINRALAIVSLVNLLSVVIFYEVNVYFVGRAWLLSSTTDSLRPGSTDRHVYSLCQWSSQRHPEMDPASRLLM